MYIDLWHIYRYIYKIDLWAYRSIYIYRIDSRKTRHDFGAAFRWDEADRRADRSERWGGRLARRRAPSAGGQRRPLQPAVLGKALQVCEGKQRSEGLPATRGQANTGLNRRLAYFTRFFTSNEKSGFPVASLERSSLTEGERRLKALGWALSG